MATNTEQEDLWKYSLKSIFSIKDKVFKLMANPSDSESGEDEGTLEEKENFIRFLGVRRQAFV